ncbi:MAG TPA: NAD(P)/FAD-dependent oxidoreductase, partial [Acidimicrobiia bacterium]|nr:NAD(P)/FAD-dependent oxidoreductase [Acidimicrobiia bacterium]
MTEPTEFDVVIVGAGFAGMYMLHRARGMGLKARVYDSAGGVGGTWYWNRYPGARCDIESMEYSYQFDDELQQEWEWTERYAAQPEILRYAEHVADRLGLRPDMQFNTRVLSATYGDDERWAVKLDTGEDLTTQFLIMATGCLSSANIPDFKGRDTFEGDTYHTGRWPHAPVDFTGKRVAVIGTGSSAIQSIPIIAEQASELYVFQRTAAYTVPARNGPIDQNYVEEVKADYAGFRARNSQMVTAFGSNVPLNDVSALAVSEEEREAKYWERWEHGGFFFLGAFNDLMLNADANATAGQFVRDRIREIVQDPEVAERLLPSTVIGCKRLCLDTHYYATYNRPN